MPLKPSYLLIAGVGGIVVYSGIKGKGIGSAIRTVISGQSPSTAATASPIQTASYPASAFGYGSPGNVGATGTGQAPGTTTAAGRGTGSGQLPVGTTSGATLSRAAAKALGYLMVAAAGWRSQWPAFNSIVMAESGWDTTIHNGGGHGYIGPNSAYGIPQALPGDKMASAGANWQTSSATQIKWMIGYIRSSYGDPDNAWAFHQRNGWY